MHASMACASHMMNVHIPESAHTGNLAIVTRPFSLAEGVRSGDETNRARAYGRADQGGK